MTAPHYRHSVVQRESLKRRVGLAVPQHHFEVALLVFWLRVRQSQSGHGLALFVVLHLHLPVEAFRSRVGLEMHRIVVHARHYEVPLRLLLVWEISGVTGCDETCVRHATWQTDFHCCHRCEKASVGGKYTQRWQNSFIMINDIKIFLQSCPNKCGLTAGFWTIAECEVHGIQLPVPGYLQGHEGFVEHQDGGDGSSSAKGTDGCGTRAQICHEGVRVLVRTSFPIWNLVHSPVWEVQLEGLSGVNA